METKCFHDMFSIHVLGKFEKSCGYASDTMVKWSTAQKNENVKHFLFQIGIFSAYFSTNTKTEIKYYEGKLSLKIDLKGMIYLRKTILYNKK